MRFSCLELKNLPRKGVIAIEGPNESGKTTIGEAILFAFFGKTPKNRDLPVSQLIRWNTDKLSVEVEFSIEGKGEFLIYREIDKYGTNYVKLLESQSRRELGVGHIKVSQFLSKVLRFDYFEFQNSFYLNQFQAVDRDGVDPEFLERMTGSKQINEAIRSLNLEIEELEREFALYERDIQRNKQQIEKFDASINSLDELRDGAERISKEDHEDEARKTWFDRELKEFNNFSDALARSSRQLEKASDCSLAPMKDILQEGVHACQAFEREEESTPVRKNRAGRDNFLKENRGSYEFHRTLCGDLSQWATSYTDLRQTVQDHCDGLSRQLSSELDESLPAKLKSMEEKFQHQKRFCSRLSLIAFLFLLPAVLFGITSGLVLAEKAQAAPILKHLESVVDKDQAPALLVGTSLVFLVIFLGLAFARSSAGSKRRLLEGDLQEIRKNMGDSEAERQLINYVLSKSGPGEVSDLSSGIEKIKDVSIQKKYRELMDVGGRWNRDEEQLRKLLGELRQSQMELQKNVKKEVRNLEKLLQELVSESSKRRSEKSRINNEIKDGETNTTRKNGLVIKNDELEGKASSLHDKIELRRISVKLLDETDVRIRNRIGPTLSRFVCEILPVLTENRYRDLKIDNELRLKLFSSEKNDFMDMTEVSGGTLESLKLALRLAISQVMIHSRSKQPQFVFLDEPLKMTDANRTDKILEAIRTLSPDMQQIFIIQPNFTPQQRELFERIIQTDEKVRELVQGVGEGDSVNPSTDSSHEKPEKNHPGGSSSILQY